MKYDYLMLSEKYIRESEEIRRFNVAYANDDGKNVEKDVLKGLITKEKTVYQGG
jgi:hypothetical protein